MPLSSYPHAPEGILFLTSLTVSFVYSRISHERKQAGYLLCLALSRSAVRLRPTHVGVCFCGLFLFIGESCLIIQTYLSFVYP